MLTRAFAMKLNPGVLDEYRRRHDEIWPELSTLLKQAGIIDYHIFHDASRDILFAYMTVEEENGLVELPDHPVMRRWWHYMAPLMETDATERPVEIGLDLVFRLN